MVFFVFIYKLNVMNINNIIREEYYINELLFHDDFSKVNELLYMTTFIIFKSHVYFFDYTDSQYKKKVIKFGKMLYDLNIVNSYPQNDADNDDCENYLRKTLLKSPHIIVGYFVESFNDKLPRNTIVGVIINNPYYEFRVSDVLNKLIKLLPNLNYYEIEGETYSKDELINKNQNKLIKLPDVVYHGTSSEHIDSILKNGIRPMIGNSSFKVKNEKYVFLTTSFEVADSYAKSSISKNFNMSTYKIILEVNSNQLDINKIVYDYDFYINNVGNGNDEYNKMSGLKNRYDLPLSDKGNSRVSGQYKKFGYDGIILPTKIRGIYYNKNNSSKYEYLTINDFMKNR